MMRKTFIAVATALAVAAPGLALAADPPAAQAQTPEAQAPPPAPEPKIEKVETPAGPPVEMKKLAMLEGNWTTKSHRFESPLGPESDYSGKANFKLILSGMHMEGDHEFHVGGEPERGRSTWGWDPEKKQYHLTFISSRHPSSMAYYGTFASDSTMVFYTTYMMQGKAITDKMTVTFSGPTHYTMAIENDMSGEMKKFLQETATRVKATPKKAAPAKKPATTTKKAG